jgi:signal peptidase II
MTRWLGIAALVVVLDRITKLYVSYTLDVGEYVPVLPVFGWIHLNNRGAAFSLLHDAGGWQRWFFVALAVGFVVYLVVELRRLGPRPKGTDLLYAWGFALVMGGAIGNLYDRAVHGFVVDFVLLHYGEYYFPAFNVADSGITVGAACWILAMLIEARRKRAQTP